MEILFQLLLVFGLILINGFFAAAEYALVTVRKTRIDELAKKGDFIASLVQKAIKDQENFIAATQLGTTIVNLLIGWLGEPIIAKVFVLLFSFLPQGFQIIFAHTFAIITALIFLTFFTLVIGELVPKTIALYKSEAVSFITITPLYFFTLIFKPFIRVLNISGTFILKKLGLSGITNTPLLYSKDEVNMIFTQIKQSGVVDKNELEMMQNVFKLGDYPISKMITPRTEIVSYDVNTPFSALVKAENTFSRFPVYKKTLDNVIGFIHIKDVFKYFLQGKKNKKLSENNIIRKVISIPETKKANEVLIEMRKKHVHLAVVYDEFGVMTGIVTMEDIVESLIGEIQDEFDKPLSGIQRNSDGSYLVDGNTPIEKIQNRFRLPIKGQVFSTIGGLIFGLLGRPPRTGDKVLIGHLYFEVKTISGKRIKSIVLRRESKKNDHNL